MSDFLLELASEEIPARMQAKAAEQLAARFADGLKGRVSFDRLETFVTPRRLALYAHGVAAAGNAVSEERRGPRTDAPAQALEGFLRSTGLTRDQLEERDTPKGKFFYANLHSEGRPTVELLAELIPQIVRDFDWPKSMRWGASSMVSSSPRWVRPLTGIVALFDDAIVPFEIAGVASGRTTRGHRFLSRGRIDIAHPRFYAAELRDAHVIVDAAERRQIISDRAHALAAESGLTLIEDDGLLHENAGLTEWPVPLLGHFNPAFLNVPPEVIQLTMRTNQKYFAATGADGKLAPVFVAVANIAANDSGAAIAAGNARVLSARLSDAKFFWDADLKRVREGGLEAFTPKLVDIVFHEKLGTLADKVTRVAEMARLLAGYIRGCDAEQAEKAAKLCKADLVSATVGEFPEVQGLAGGYLARAAGLPDAVADAIRDHYKPVGQGDAVPTAPVSVAVALADKLDTLIQFFSIDETPTGSRDPFALRRAMIGVICLTLENGIRLPLHVVLQRELGRHRPFALGTGTKFMDFAVERVKVQQREAGVRHDLIDATFTQSTEDDLVRLLARVRALQAFLSTDDGANLLAGYRRAANILAAEAKKDGVTRYDTEGTAPHAAADTALADTLSPVAAAAKAAIASEDFTGAMAALAQLRAPIDAFFTAVMVNDPDPAVRHMRLSLLQRFRDAVHDVADFSKIEG
jgi:glycyl-tRNA synthetase beta chain